jgi:indole-3-glycerol phosphate synthase
MHKPLSLKRAITSARNNAIIAEIKPASPSLGKLRINLDPVDTAMKMVNGGAIALSVLTEPDNFAGSLANLLKVRRRVTVPLLMKDIIINSRQIEAGIRVGADAVLLIHSALQRNDANSVSELIEFAHDRGAEVLLEVHDEAELGSALKSEADVIGVNNRNLETLQTDLDTTVRLISSRQNRSGKCVVSESGFARAEDVQRLKSSVVDGFLIGSSIMMSENLERKVREFVMA